MAQPLISCPLCSATSFSNTTDLCLSLVSVTSKWLRCTVCEEELKGLDKLTVHLLSHLIHNPNFKRLLGNDESSSETSMFLSSQPLNLVKNHNEPKSQDFINSPLSIGMVPPSSLGTGNKCERPSLKIDDQVMIFFNCDNMNEGSPIEPGKMNIVRVLDKETPSSSGLPKFTISFDNKAYNQSENVSYSANESILSGGNFSEERTTNEPQECLFPTSNIDQNSESSNVLIPVKDNEIQMEYFDGEKEKDVHSFSNFKCVSDMRNEAGSFNRNTTNQICGKSSYLSPKGERVLGFRCDICSLIFPDEHILSMHRKLIHIELHGTPSEPMSYKCHLCSKSFVMKGSLMVHMRVAHFGGAVVARLLEAKQLETNAVSPDSAEFICSICNKGFQKEQQLIQHEKLHDGKQCDICLKTFTTKYFLRKHKRLHTGEMPYQCSQCNKSFTFQQSYHKHLLYHNDDKPYSCGECGRAFKELSTLHNHQRIHTGEKPFSCETCDLLTMSVF